MHMEIIMQQLLPFGHVYIYLMFVIYHNYFIASITFLFLLCIFCILSFSHLFFHVNIAHFHFFPLVSGCSKLSDLQVSLHCSYKKAEGSPGSHQNTVRSFPSVYFILSKSLPFHNGDGNFYVMGNLLPLNHIKQHVRSRIAHLFHMIVHSRKLGRKIHGLLFQ